MRTDLRLGQGSRGEVLIWTGGSGVTRHVYDAVGQRVLRVDADGSKTVYLGATELRWEPGSTAVQAARSYPGGVRREFDGSLTYLVGDHQGSIQAAVDAASGAITFNRQLPYGEPRQGVLVDDKGFLGQTHDPETSLVYLNNRYHDPQLGAFISVDPLVVKTGEPYIYGAANPITYSDLSGLEVCYDSGPKKGQCYEAADGEEWAQTPLEEVLIVQNPTVDPETVVGTWRAVNAAQWDTEDEVQQEQRWTLFYSSLYGGEFDPLVLLIETVGDASTVTGYVATGCGLFAWTVVGAECAAIAGGASLGLGATEAALLAATNNPDAKCSAAGVALDVIVPDVPVPTSGDFAGEIAVNTVKAVAGHAVDLTC